MSIWLQKAASVQTRTSPLKFDHLAGRHRILHHRIFHLSGLLLLVSDLLPSSLSASSPGCAPVALAETTQTFKIHPFLVLYYECLQHYLRIFVDCEER